jgi:hypothetical protein
VFGADAILVTFDDVLDQIVLVCVDESSQVSVLCAEATDLAGREEFDDGE